MGNDRILSLIGLETKAGKVASGEFSTEKAIKGHKACMVVVASDASDNTKKMFENMCAWHKVPMIVYGTKESLGIERLWHCWIWDFTNRLRNL